MGYRVLAGIDYPPNKRAEAGAVVNDLPPQSVKWLLEMGLIEDSSKPAKAKEEPTPVIEETVETPVEPVAEPIADAEEIAEEE